MKPLDVAVAFRVTIRCAAMRDAQPVQGLEKPGRSELCAVVGGQGHARLPSGSRWSTACSTASSAAFRRRVGGTTWFSKEFRKLRVAMSISQSLLAEFEGSAYHPKVAHLGSDVKGCERRWTAAIVKSKFIRFSPKWTKSKFR
jgi:hypothetical protein